jgi:TolB protein
MNKKAHHNEGLICSLILIRDIRSYLWYPRLRMRVASAVVLPWPLAFLMVTSLALAQDLSLVRLTTDGYFKQRPRFSPEGDTLVFARHKQEKIWLYLCDAEGGNERRLTMRDLPEYDAAWTPDGQRLAFCHVSQSGTQGDVDLFAIQRDGSALTALIRNAGPLSHEEWPAYSPDGRLLAFTSTRSGNQEVFVSNTDGRNARPITNHTGHDAHPCWSPDGRQIAFATDRWGGLEIALMDADGGNVCRLTQSVGLDDYPDFSPDGRWIAFVSNRDGNFEIYRMRPDGTDAQNLSRSPALDTFPCWSPDSRSLVFVSNRQERFDLYRLAVNREREGRGQ